MAQSEAGADGARDHGELVSYRLRRERELSSLYATARSLAALGEVGEVLATIERHGLTAANVNGAGQVVAAGALDALVALADDAPAKARVIPLSVAGAFHTEYMSPAVETLSRLSRAVSTHDARVPLLSNSDGTVVGSGSEVLRRIVRQVSSPVRWSPGSVSSPSGRVIPREASRARTPS